MKHWLVEKIRGNEKLISAAVTVPIMAAGTISGACAAGCPYGLVNDPYPGQCGRFIDVTGNGICDLSQATAASTPTSTASISDTSSSSASTSNSHSSNSGDQTSNGASADTAVVDQNDSANASVVTDQGSGLDSNTIGDSGGYYVIPVSFLIIGGYLLTHYLFSKGILSHKKHRKIWNLLVTAGYVGTGITGVFLTLMINLGIRTALNPSVTFWHGELAVVMVIGTVIHMHIYKNPLNKMLKVLFGFNSDSKKKSDEGAGRSK